MVDDGWMRMDEDADGFLVLLIVVVAAVAVSVAIAVVVAVVTALSRLQHDGRGNPSRLRSCEDQESGHQEIETKHQESGEKGAVAVAAGQG